jgi:transcriptional regulator with XRE-family HTH domain
LIDYTKWCEALKMAEDGMLRWATRMRGLREKLGARLKQLRQEQELRAHDAAAEVGVDVTHLYNIERGVANPSLELLVALAATYRVDVADLFVFPDGGPRHAIRELARLTPNAKLDALRAAVAEVAEEPAARARKTR